MRKWCSTISDYNIKNKYQPQVRSKLKVYCGTSMDASYKWYSDAKTSYVVPKIEADSNRCPLKYKHSLYQLWMQHPNIRDACCYSDSNYHITLMMKLFKFGNDFYKLIGGLKSTVAIELRNELTKLCSSSSTDQFCSIKAALDTIDVALRLPADKNTWTQTTETYRKAVLISFVILKRKFSTEYSRLVINNDDIIVQSTNIILKHIQKKEVSQLREFATYLPPNDAYLPKTATCGTNQLCIFMKTVEQVRMYLDEANLDTNPILVNGKKRLILNTAVDYREFLRQKQLDRILTVLAEQSSTSLQIANDLKEHTTTKFSELRTYFEKVETFNQQIASADIGYVNGRLEYYTRSVNRIVGKLKQDVAFLLKQAFIGVGLNIAEKIIIQAVAIAEAGNPLKWVFSGGALTDALKAAAELSNAIADLVKLTRIKSSFNKLKSTTADVATRIEKNNDFLQNVKNLINRKTVTRKQFEASKSSFVEKYTAYDPQVTKPELVEIGTIWVNVVDAICGVIDAIDTAAGSVVKNIVYKSGLCSSLKHQVEKMFSTYEEIYDFQFDLINAMAAYVRSSVALDAAKEINSEFTEVTKLNVNSGTTLTTLAMMGGLSFVSYKVHILKTVHLYCNALEYMEGGKQPSECKGVNTDVALLIANTQPVCRSETTRFYKVPTTKPSTNSSDDKLAYIDIGELYSGNEVSFKIPSSDWLIENDWIGASESNYSFYVKRFEVYLPTKTDYPQILHTTATPVLHNEVIPGSTEYTIVPNMPLVYEYSMGPSRLNCHIPKFSNPYTSCETSDVSQICEHSHSIKHHLYPSIYSQWKLSIKGGENMTVPDPATDLPLVIGIQLCKIAPYEYDEYQNAAVVEEMEQCCPSGEYRQGMKSDCMSCPANSRSALAGYYCEKD